MASDSALMYYDKVESSGQQRNGSHPERMQARLNPEEIRVLKECNKESFYYRSVPFAVIAIGATQLAATKGFLKPHPKYGVAFKHCGAAIIGWFLGKLSYRSACEEKFLHLQNSSIADAIRKKRGYITENSPDLSLKKEDDFIGSQHSGLSDSDYHSSFGSLNLDTDKNVQYSGLDDRERPSLDSSVDSLEEVKPPQHPVTYDELRRRNRENYEQQSRTQHPTSSSQSRSSQSQRLWGRQERSQTEGNDQPKNIYGDVWER